MVSWNIHFYFPSFCISIFASDLGKAKILKVVRGDLDICLRWDHGCLKMTFKYLLNQNIKSSCLFNKKKKSFPSSSSFTWSNFYHRTSKYIPISLDMSHFGPWFLSKTVPITYQEVTGWLTSYNICADKWYHAWLKLDVHKFYWKEMKSIQWKPIIGLRHEKFSFNISQTYMLSHNVLTKIYAILLLFFGKVSYQDALL